MKRPLIAAIAATGLLVAAPAAGATTTVAVTQQDILATFASRTVSGAGSYALVGGPAAAPLGHGSLQLSTPSHDDKVKLLTSNPIGTQLNDAVVLRYATFRHASSTAIAVQQAGLNMEVQTPSGGTTLVFDPFYTYPDASVHEGVWKHWDAGGEAKWFSTSDIPGACAYACPVPLSEIKAANPGAVILSYGLNQGIGNGGLLSSVDALQLNDVTYDFEPDVVTVDPQVPTGPVARTAKECRHGGFATKFPPTTYRNTGHCVRDLRSAR